MESILLLIKTLPKINFPKVKRIEVKKPPINAGLIFILALGSTLKSRLNQREIEKIENKALILLINSMLKSGLY